MIIPRRKPYFAPNSFSKIANSFFRKNYTNSTTKLENELQKVLGIPNPVIISSGRIGLGLILKHAGLKLGTEIILPAYTFGPLFKVIKDSGFKPVAVDIDPNNFQLSAKEVKKAVTNKTSAIIATHLFGEPCDILEIKKITDKKNLLLIEDCAQSIGATKNNKQLGTYGEVSISSFNIAKPLQGITGGLVFGKNKKIVNKIKADIKNSQYDQKNIVKDVIRGLLGLFLSQTIFWFVLMYLFSFEKIQEAFVKFYRSFESKKTSFVLLHPILSKLILLNLSTYNTRLEKRRQIRQKYLNELGHYLKFQKIVNNERGTVDMLVARVNANVHELRRHLSIKGIDIAILDEIADLKSNKFKHSLDFFSHSIALPLYESMSDKEVRHVSRSIIEFIGD